MLVAWLFIPTVSMLKLLVCWHARVCCNTNHVCSLLPHKHVRMLVAYGLFVSTQPVLRLLSAWLLEEARCIRLWSFSLQGHAETGEGDGEQGRHGVFRQVPAQSRPRSASVVPPDQTGAANTTLQAIAGG